MFKTKLLHHYPSTFSRFCPKTGLPLSYGYANPFTIEMEELVEKSFAHILKQVQIPHIEPQTKKLSTSNIFSKIDTIATNTSPDCKVYVYGGVVRSILSFIYWHLMNEHQKNPGNLQTKQILENFLRKNETYDFQFVLGLGSDLDILIDEQGSLNKIDSVSAEVAEFLDRYQNLLPLEMRTLFSLYGDVKNYDIQVPRSARQGGSPIDWLSFPITERSGNSFREPQTHPGIIKNFLQGRIKIYPVDYSEARADTVSRVIRTILDLPFLEPDLKSSALICQEIKKLPKDPQSKIPNTFKKGVRNARFYQGYPHPVNRFTKHTTDALALALKQHSLQYRTDNDMPLLPEVLESQNILERPIDFDPGNLRKDHLLTSLDEFNLQYTDCGHLYHGTKNPLNLLSMFRGTFFVSNTTQGNAAHGRGFYASKSQDVALQYSGGSSTNILRFKIFSAPNIRIVNLKSIPRQTLKQWELSASQANLDLHSFLFEKLFIDIIINEFVLIQNKSVIYLPNSISQMQSEWIDASLNKWLYWKSENLSFIRPAARQEIKSVALLLASAKTSIFQIPDLKDKIAKIKEITKYGLSKWELASDSSLLDIILPWFENDLETMFDLIQQNPSYISKITAPLKNKISQDPTQEEKLHHILIKIILDNPKNLEHIPKETSNYQDLALKAVKKSSTALKHVFQNTPNYQTIALTAVQQSGMTLQFVPKETANYEKIALAAVQQNGFSLKYVPLECPQYEIIEKAANHQLGRF